MPEDFIGKLIMQRTFWYNVSSLLFRGAARPADHALPNKGKAQIIHPIKSIYHTRIHT